MVKRKHNGDVSNPDQSQMSMGQQVDPSMMPPNTSKRTRVNPQRSARAAAASELPAKMPKPPAAKRARVSRAKQVSSQSTTAVLPEAGSSQTAPPPPKRGRKKAAPAADASGSQPEKRGAVFKSQCPQNILDRVERVMTQRLCRYRFYKLQL